MTDVLRVDPGGSLRGHVRVVSDKSITHRGIILGWLASGESRIASPNTGGDCRALLDAVVSLGAVVVEEEGAWRIRGTAGVTSEPETVLDLGNSGTALRLLAGAVAPSPHVTILTGDASLRSRPMERVAAPLRAMGAVVITRSGGRAPLVIRGGPLRPLRHDLPVASAQVKSALLFAGLRSRPGRMVLHEPGPARDHTERFLRHLGVALETDGGRIAMTCPAQVPAFEVAVPADPSAAAFFAVAAAVTLGSDVVLEDVGLNPRRMGFLRILKEMDACIDVVPEGDQEPEPRGRIRIRHGALRGVDVPADDVATFLDEIPILAVAAAFAQGTTSFQGLEELRHKETDRLETTASMIRALGGRVEGTAGGLRIQGAGGEGLAGGSVESRGDHRIAMSAAVAGCAAGRGVEVRGARWIGTSDPEFLGHLLSLRGGTP